MMEHLRPDLDQIKQLSMELEKINIEKDLTSQQLNQYRTSVSSYIHKIRRAESLLEFDDPEISSLTEATTQKVRNMEDKIQSFNDDYEKLCENYENIFEKRKSIVNKVVQELNQSITYAYPFGTEEPTIRMGKYYKITDDGDVVCELKYESNSFFNKNFRQII